MSLVANAKKVATNGSGKVPDQFSNCSKAFVENIRREDLYLSVITIGEVVAGIKRLDDKKKYVELTTWLENGLMDWFGDRILSIDTKTMLQWGSLQFELNRTLPVMDSLIAATAITHGLTLVTRNTKDFIGYKNLPLINPWSM